MLEHGNTRTWSDSASADIAPSRYRLSLLVQPDFNPEKDTE